MMHNAHDKAAYELHEEDIYVRTSEWNTLSTQLSTSNHMHCILN